MYYGWDEEITTTIDKEDLTILQELLVTTLKINSNTLFILETPSIDGS